MRSSLLLNQYYTESFMNFPIITKNKLKKKCPCPKINKQIYNADIIIPAEDKPVLPCCTPKPQPIYYKVNEIVTEEKEPETEDQICQEYSETCLYSITNKGKNKLSCFTYKL